MASAITKAWPLTRWKVKKYAKNWAFWHFCRWKAHWNRFDLDLSDVSWTSKFYLIWNELWTYRFTFRRLFFAWL